MKRSTANTFQPAVLQGLDAFLPSRSWAARSSVLDHFLNRSARFGVRSTWLFCTLSGAAKKAELNCTKARKLQRVMSVTLEASRHLNADPIWDAQSQNNAMKSQPSRVGAHLQSRVVQRYNDAIG